MRLIAALLVLCGGLAWADPSERIALNVTDPSRPVSLTFEQTNGNIRIHGTDSREVTIEVASRRRESRSDGMHRIPMDLNAEESNNNVRIRPYGAGRDRSYDVYVPMRTSLYLRSTNGDIFVENVDGEIDASSNNGDVTLNNVAGAAVAHSLNGELKASFTRCDTSKPMSFSSMNGRIDLTFPSNLRANLRLRNQNGSINTDFEVRLQPNGAQSASRRDKTMIATVNGGGPEIQVSNFNGGIYLRKGR